MSAPVDVMAVLHSAACALAIYCPEADDAAHAEMREAREAVAALIEAASTTVERFASVEDELIFSKRIALRRQRDALARVRP